MINNITLCNHCAGTIVLSLGQYIEATGLKFCCLECAEAYFSQDNPEPYPVGLVQELGVEEYCL